MTRPENTENTDFAELQLDRARGALWGLALGDALGMPTQSMSRQAIRETYGKISGFVAGAANQPIAPGMPAGSVTDDTDQALILGRLLIAGEGHVAPLDFATALMEWEEKMIATGSKDLLGPSTKRALEALRAGASPHETGKAGTTNGAAMRVAPVGIANSLAEPASFLAAVAESCSVTHNTNLGISGAAAIAATISAAIDSPAPAAPAKSAAPATPAASAKPAVPATLAQISRALDAGLACAYEAEKLGTWCEGASIPARFAHARTQVKGMSETEFGDYLAHVVGTSVASQESVVCALLIVEHFGTQIVRGLTFAAELGGDTDTIGAMAGAIFGALCGFSALPPNMVETMSSVQNLDIDAVATGLLALRKPRAA
ncbi:ADP-ribosyl-[dinitrogen reductase] glycohydrolase [Actinobaculum suis]|uniref:ADP-ribosyl-[dinitrogen reductase] glycohydrolase n=1 Tax=Actinobaculum suis TaxID=1657 RepID=A0A7Z8YBK9_9ACTO|nr:ADP-ribosylglycohydrolase family protein [Actinobaculum suis]VDG77288.1 ADP-ribosyl-[dinitrogen reductase] glycohydrolase [Actinobaculum suis]